MRHLGRLHILEEVRGQRREFRIVHRRGDLDPGDAALAAGHRSRLGRDAADLRMTVGARRRGRVGAARQVEVDLARDQRLVHRGDVADHLGALEHALGSLGELRHFLVGVHLERIEAGDAADVEDVPVVRFENAVLAGIGRVVPQVPALVLGGGAAHLVGVDDEAVGPEALRHAEQLRAGIVHRPLIGRLERPASSCRRRARSVARSSGLISFSGNMTLRAQGLLTLIRSQTLVSPARSRLIMVGSLVSDSALTVAPVLAAERIEHLGRVVALPAQDVQFLLARRLRAARQNASGAGEGRGHECRLLHEIAA